MKKVLLCLFTVVGFLLSSTFLYAQVVVTNPVIDEITKTCTSLFGALRRGDLRTIKLYLSADEYARYKVLFEQNKEYSAFLRNFYAGAHLRVGQVDSVRSATDDVIAEFLVDFPGGETLNTRMRLNRDKAGSWKIMKTLRDKKDQGEPDGENRH